MITVDVHDVHIQYALVCPKCDWVHWLSEPQYNDNSYHVTCDCGAKFKPAKISLELTNRVEKNKLDKELLKLAKSLTEMGLSLSEAKNRIKLVYQEGKDLQTIFREVMSLG